MHWVVHFSLINSGTLPSSTLVHVLDVGFFNSVIPSHYIDRTPVVLKVNC